MLYPVSTRKATLAVLTLFVAASFAVAQKNDRSQDPENRARKVKPEVKKAYQNWLDKDVAYIITDEERKAFKKLQTDDEREQFIEMFWARRNPDPDSDTNSYREEYYERIAYANEHFASGIPGWKTDRGRIYIRFGKPDEIETHPSGGNYERPSNEGGGSTSTYPFERWFYRYLAGVGSGIEIEFVDPTGSGEYRIAQSPDEKDALLHVPGAGLTLSEQLGMTNKADRIVGTGATNNGLNYQREQDNPFTKLQTLAALNRAPQVKFTDLESKLAGSDTGKIDENPLNFDLRVDFFRQSDNNVITAFTVQTENNQLTFADSGGAQMARINIFGKITSVANRRVGIFEDPVITTATPSELATTKDRKSAYQKAIALQPGHYKVDVIVRDVNSGATGIRSRGFEVPRFDPNKLSTSTLILAAKLQNMADQPAVGQFVIGPNKVIPNLSGIFHKGEPVGVYMQIYNAGIDQTTLRPSVDVEYQLTRGGKEVGKQAEDWRGAGDAGQKLTVARLLNSSNLTPGEYNIVVHIRDKVSGQELSPSAKFTIVQ